MVTDKTRREAFITQNLGLVHACAGRFRGRGMEYDDLYSAGCVGLIKAYDNFDESRGESIAAMMERSPHFLHWQPGDHTRLAGKMQFHYRLRFAPDGRPMLQVFSSCKHFIRTLPNLVYDESNVEDIDTRQEDHIYDECRYVLMEHPISPPETSAAPPRPDDPLELHRQARFYRI